MADNHKNFAYSTVVTAPSPATTGTSLTVQSGDGALFPTPPFNVTLWPVGAQPTLTGVAGTTAEVVRVTAIVDDTFTIVRLQEGLSTARTVVVGDQVAAAVTTKTLTDAEDPITFWTPYVLGSGAASGLQTIAANATANVGTNSLFVFPVTVPPNLQFNQILVPVSLSHVSSAIAAASNSYYSMWGLYTMNANTALSLLTSSSFSIAETLNQASLTWNYPTTTATSGYGTGSMGGTGLSVVAQVQSFIQSSRVVGLHFGVNTTLTGGVYWLGLLSLKSTANSRSTYGLSNAGIMGMVVNTLNQVGTVNGPLPIGAAISAFSGTNASHLTQWWGRHIVGFLTNTVRAGFAGTIIPSAVTLSELAGFAANSTATVLPAITFVST